MIARLLVILALFASLQTSRAANWYINPTNSSGTTNGTSWATGWADPRDVVWGSIAAGDIIYLSGGSTERIYTNSFTIQRNGTSANPIVVRPGRDSGHNGMVIFSNAVIRPYINGTTSYAYGIWIDGSRDSAFVAPTNHQQVISGATAITNNIGIRIKDVIGVTAIDDNDPSVWYFSQTPSYFRVSYVEVSGLTNTLCDANCDWKGTVCYINSNNAGTNNVWEYLYLHDNVSQVFSSQAAGSFGAFEVKFSYMPYNGEDHFEIKSGWSIHDNIIGPVRGYGKSHTDFFQMTGNQIKIYNNLLHSSANSYYRLQSQAGGTPRRDLRYDVWFFNNIQVENNNYPDGGAHGEPNTVVNFDPLNPADLVTYSNILTMNNLYIRSTTNKVVPPYTYANNSVVNWSTGDKTVVTNVYMVSNIFANNLMIDIEKGVSLPISTNLLPTKSVWPYTTNDFWADYNTLAATNSALTTPTSMNYMDTNITGSATPYTFSNNTNYPAFQDQSTDNFELLGTDTVALNRGYNLSAYFDFDALNRPRNIGGAWDRGPLEYQETNLIVWLTFEDDWQNAAYITDYSGYGNHAHRFGNYSFPSSTTNWPVRLAATNSPGSNTVGYAAQFDWTTGSSYSFYDREGAYAALTNGLMLTNLTRATFAMWARHEANQFGTYLGDHTATFLSAGGGAAGKESSWNFGRNSSPETRFGILTNVSGSSTKDFSFPDKPVSESGWDGNTTNWHHYAVTFSNGVLLLYYDGTNYSSGDVSGTTTALNIGMNGGEAPWIGLGVNTHGGDYYMRDASQGGGDDYPNNGWMNGYLDDVRIYNRVLSAAEILDVYEGNAAAGGSSGSSGGGSGTSNTPRLSPKFRNFRAFRP